MSFPNFSSMPPEVTERFLLKLPIETIRNFCKTDKFVSNVCSTDLFWKKLVNRDFHVTNLTRTDSWKSLYQLLSTEFYSYRFHDDYNNVAGNYLTLNEALDQMLEQIDENHDLLRLIIDYSDLDQRTNLQQDVIDSIVMKEYDEVLHEIQDDSIMRKQFTLVRRAVQDIIRDEVHDTFIKQGRRKYELIDTDRDSEYIIEKSKFLLSTESKMEFDFIQTEYDRNNEFLGRSIRKIDLRRILHILRSHKFRNPILKDGVLTYWITRGDKTVLQPLDEDQEPIITQFFMQNARDLF